MSTVELAAADTPPCDTVRWHPATSAPAGLKSGRRSADHPIVATQSVLVVEDTDEIRELVTTVLRRAGLDVREAISGAAALAEVRRDAPDLIVLDLGLPDADGTEVCRQIRAETQCYVLMLTARAEEVDLLIGLAVGADGYMAKPFSPGERVARVRAMLRSPRQVQSAEAAAPAEESVRRLAELEVDEESREVRVDGIGVDLTRTEFDLLAALASRPGRVLQRETLLREVWQTDWEGNLRLVEAHMSNLRRKLVAAGLNSPEIRTVRGVGYRLVARHPLARGQKWPFLPTGRCQTAVSCRSCTRRPCARTPRRASAAMARQISAT